MTFAELDHRIRDAVSDPIQKKLILQGLHEIEEAVNQCASWYLSVSGYTVDTESGGIYRKEERPTRFQVND